MSSDQKPPIDDQVAALLAEVVTLRAQIAKVREEVHDLRASATPVPQPLHLERAIDQLQVAILEAGAMKRRTDTQVTGLTTLYAALRAAHEALVAMANEQKKGGK